MRLVDHILLALTRNIIVSQGGKSMSSQVKLSFIVIPLHVGTYSGTKCCASQDNGAT